jgi:hypothetical protein
MKLFMDLSIKVIEFSKEETEESRVKKIIENISVGDCVIANYLATISISDHYSSKQDQSFVGFYIGIAQKACLVTCDNFPPEYMTFDGGGNPMKVRVERISSILYLKSDFLTEEQKNKIGEIKKRFEGIGPAGEDDWLCYKHIH